MPERSSKKRPRKKTPTDVNTLARFLVDEATAEPGATEDAETAAPKKNPAAVALGRLGGLKGGKARAAALSKKKRSKIAKKAADARWRSRQA
jgi:hypothetical protein